MTFPDYGPPDVFSLNDIPSPKLPPDGVRIDVHATSINPVDWKIRAGGQRGVIRYQLPRVIGMDVSGVVTEVGPSVTRFKIGDEVWASPHQHSPGTYAEETVVREAQLAVKPKNLTHAEAASLPLVGLTAYQCLMPKLQEKAGQRVFIMAGSGGVGTVAIQIAKAFGAVVATTCSERNHELVRELGADQIIDYRSVDFQDVLSDMDIVIDSLGGESTWHGLSIVKKGGLLASINSDLPERVKNYGVAMGTLRTGLHLARLWTRGKMSGRDARTVIRKPLGSDLEKLRELCESERIRPVIDRTYPLEDLAEAHAYGETGRIRGKVVITVREPS